ncbi:MAG: glycosyltransferase family 39 protein [Patescibacteria group bacterium]|nr:glycosyltransferase family 39 protein [Patescibacteria group bacterium]
MKSKTTIIILIAISIAFLIIKIPQIGFRYGDENIYFYEARLITQGQLPYQNFFFASPPMELLFLAGLVAVFGFSIWALKLFLLALILGTAWLIFLWLKNITNEKAGLFAAIFYLFSFLNLATSDYYSGVQLTVFFFILSLYLVSIKKPVWAGVATALSFFTRFYAAPLILALIIYLLIKERKQFWKFIFSAGAVFILINAALILGFGQNYLQNVFSYNIHKFEQLEKLRVFRFFVQWDIALLTLATLGAALVRPFNLMILLGAAAAGLFIGFYPDIYYLYYNLLLSFLALSAGMLFARLFSFCHSDRKPEPQARAEVEESLILSIGERRRDPSTSSRYYGTSLGMTIKIVIIVLFAISGYNIYYYLKDHAGAARIDYLSELNKFVIENSTPQDKIYGSFEITPLVAGATGRQIVENFIDTNNKTFSTGIYKLPEREKILANEKVKFIITKVLVNEQGYLIELGDYISLNFLQTNCQVVKQFPIYKDYYSNLTLVWQCF